MAQTTDNTRTARPRRKMKSLEKRLHLYLFVSALLKTPLSRVSYGSWGGITEAWNQEHPHDTKSSAILAREWNRAKSDPDVLFNVKLYLSFNSANPNWRSQMHKWKSLQQTEAQPR